MKMLILSAFLLAAPTNAKVIKGTDESFETVKRMAEAGHFDYIHELALRYERGIGGVSQDFTEAVRWYCKNKVEGANASNRSMLKLEKFAESDPEVKDPTEAPTIYCEQKKTPKPSLEPFSPLKVSWCNGNDRDTVKDCLWYKQRYDEYGKPLGGKAIAEIALAELPPMSRSTDWFLDQAWKFGLYGGSISPYTWSQYQNGLIISDEKQRPHYSMEIQTKYLKKVKEGFSYSEPKPDGRMKLLLAIKNDKLRACFERGVRTYFKQTMILFQESLRIDRKYGRLVNVVLIKDCYGSGN